MMKWFRYLHTYYMNGRLVTDLVNGYIIARTHRISLVTANLSSRIYIIKMTSEEFKDHQKVILLK